MISIKHTDGTVTWVNPDHIMTMKRMAGQTLLRLTGDKIINGEEDCPVIANQIMSYKFQIYDQQLAAMRAHEHHRAIQQQMAAQQQMANWQRNNGLSGGYGVGGGGGGSWTTTNAVGSTAGSTVTTIPISSGVGTYSTAFLGLISLASLLGSLLYAVYSV